MKSEIMICELCTWKYRRYLDIFLLIRDEFIFSERVEIRHFLADTFVFKFYCISYTCMCIDLSNSIEIQ